MSTLLHYFYILLMESVCLSFVCLSVRSVNYIAFIHLMHLGICYGTFGIQDHVCNIWDVVNGWNGVHCCFDGYGFLQFQQKPKIQC